VTVLSSGSGWVFKTYNSIDKLLAEQNDVRRRLSKVVVHYTAVEPPSPSGIMKQLQSIDAYHREHNRWKGIGYHIAIHPSGLIVSLRPLRISGAHCVGHNNDSVGVVMMTDAEHIDNPHLLTTLIHVLNGLVRRFGIPPQNVFLHRQLNDTVCPPIPQNWVKTLREQGYVNIGLTRIRKVGGDKQ